MSLLSSRIIGIFGESYLVGGALRDAALKRSFTDLDLAVPACRDFKARVARLAKALDAACFELDGETQVWRLTTRSKPSFQLDIAPFQGGTMEADLKRRDFTLNALALRLQTDTPLAQDRLTGRFTLALDRKKVIDLCGGLADAAAGRIRQTSPAVFKEDPLRLLRAFRIASALDLKLSPALLKAIKKQAPLIKNSAPERVREELMRLLESPKSHQWLAALRKAGLLFEIFPELIPQEKCAVVYYGKGGVFKHTLRVVERMDTLFANLPAYIHEHAQLKEHADIGRPQIFKLAALLHDVAKPPKAALIDGRLRFFGHEEAGAVMSENIMERLRFSRDDMRLVAAVIGSHLRPGNLAANETISDRAMFRFFRAMGEYTVPLLLLCWGDHSSYISAEHLQKVRKSLQEPPFALRGRKLAYNSPRKTLRFLQTLHMLLRVYLTKNPNYAGTRLINGNDVIKTLKIKEGPHVGEILERVRLLQFEGKISDRAQALKALKGMN